MYEIATDITVERLKVFFPTREARTMFLNKTEEYTHIQRGITQISMDIEHLENFKKRFPDYEYNVQFKKVSRFKSEPVGFLIWAAVIEREVTQSQYIFNALEETEEDLVFFNK